MILEGIVLIIFIVIGILELIDKELEQGLFHITIGVIWFVLIIMRIFYT